MAPMRDKIIERIDVHIEMTQESVDSIASNIEATDDDDTIEMVTYDIKRIRTLKSLKNVMSAGQNPKRGSREEHMLQDVLEEMMDLDI